MSGQHPGAVRMIDLDRPLRAIDDVVDYSWTRLFVTDHGTLVGSVDIGNANAPISVTRLRDAIANGMAYSMMKRAVERQLSDESPRMLPQDVAVSIVIPTCNRADDLRRCLAAVDDGKAAVLHVHVTPL